MRLFLGPLGCYDGAATPELGCLAEKKAVTAPGNDPDPVELLLHSRDTNERGDLLANLFNQRRARLREVVELRMPALLRRRIDPSDVLQEAFLEALRRVGRYLQSPRMPFYLWLRRVTLYALRDLRRFHLEAQARSVRRESAAGRLGDLQATSSAMAARLVVKRSSPSTSHLRSERKAAVEKAIERLDALDREILALRFFEGLSNAEAARVLDIQVETARKRYFRALKRFK